MWLKKIFSSGPQEDDGSRFPFDEGYGYIVSFPKSGTTWMRFIFANLIQDGEVDFVNVQQLVPALRSDDKSFPIVPRKPSCFFSTHRTFDPRLKKVIYVVRDPRSVAVSNFFYRLKYRNIPKDTPFVDYLKTFFADGAGEFGTWSENVGSWVGARGYDKHFFIARYEDMLSDPVNVVSRINRFFDFQFQEDQIQKAVERCSFAAMRDAETKNPLPKWKNARKDIPFIRRGDHDEWKHYFDDRANRMIPTAVIELMKKLGYDV